MKKLMSVVLMTIGFASGAFAQGTVTFDNADSPSTGAPIFATSFGSIYFNNYVNIHNALLHQDINLTLLGGPSASSLSNIVTLTLAGPGTAIGDWSFLSNPGQFLDPSGSVYGLPGVALNGTGFVQVEAWLGNDLSYAAALADYSATGQTPVYATLTGGGSVGGNPPNNPISIGDAMPSFIVAPPDPEPSTLALFGLGATSLLFFRRKK